MTKTEVTNDVDCSQSRNDVIYGKFNIFLEYVFRRAATIYRFFFLHRKFRLYLVKEEKLIPNNLSKELRLEYVFLSYMFYKHFDMRADYKYCCDMNTTTAKILELFRLNT